MNETDQRDPREAEGIAIVQEVSAPYQLVESRHTSPETGGTLDYGIVATLDGQQVLIGELFARAPMKGCPEGVRINTQRIGKRMVATLNGCAGLNPAGYRACVETGTNLVAWLNESLTAVPGYNEAMMAFEEALANATKTD